MQTRIRIVQYNNRTEYECHSRENVTSADYYAAFILCFLIISIPWIIVWLIKGDDWEDMIIEGKSTQDGYSLPNKRAAFISIEEAKDFIDQELIEFNKKKKLQEEKEYNNTIKRSSYLKYP